MKEIKNLLTDKAEIVENTLQEIMDIKEPSSDTLLEAMEYSLFSGGKRIRPVLTIMTAELVEGNEKIARKVGAVVELIHTYSLVHDDLPSMDDDDYRRGKPANHKVFGTGVSILAGDALLTYAFEILSRLNFSPDRLIKIIQIISQAAGLNGMVGGQVLDLEAEGENLELDDLKFVHQNKTGALMKCSILAGAYCGDPNHVEIEALKEFSHYIGILFQIVDDILDVIGDAEKMGKSVGKDEELEKSTYPNILGLEQAKKEAEEMAEKANSSLDIFGKKADELKMLTDFVLKRQY